MRQFNIFQVLDSGSVVFNDGKSIIVTHKNRTARGRVIGGVICDGDKSFVLDMWRLNGDSWVHVIDVDGVDHIGPEEAQRLGREMYEYEFAREKKAV